MKNLSTCNIQTMSSLEIAELTGKLHKNVMRDIKKILNEVEIDTLKFELIYRDISGREQMRFELPKRECDLIIAGYSAKYRLAIIDRWVELELLAKPEPQALTNFQSIDSKNLTSFYINFIRIGQASGLSPLESNVSANTACENVFGCSIHALNGTQDRYIKKSNNVVSIKDGLTVVTKQPEEYMIPTEVGRRVSDPALSGFEVNVMLETLGLQIRVSTGGKGKPWVLTKEGLLFGKNTYTLSNTSSYPQIRWSHRIVPILKNMDWNKEITKEGIAELLNTG